MKIKLRRWHPEPKKEIETLAHEVINVFCGIFTEDEIWLGEGNGYAGNILEGDLEIALKNGVLIYGPLEDGTYLSGPSITSHLPIDQEEISDFMETIHKLGFKPFKTKNPAVER